MSYVAELPSITLNPGESTRGSGTWVNNFSMLPGQQFTVLGFWPKPGLDPYLNLKTTWLAPASGTFLDSYNAGGSFQWELEVTNIGYTVKTVTPKVALELYPPTPPPPVEYSLAISVQGMGTTAPSSGTYTYAAGAMATVTAIPAGGWIFSRWTLNGAQHTNNPLNITMNGDANLTAYFTKLEEAHALALDASPKVVEMGGQTAVTARLTRDDAPVPDKALRILYQNPGEDWAPLAGPAEGVPYTDADGVSVHTQLVDPSWFRADTVKIKTAYPADLSLPRLAESAEVTLTLKKPVSLLMLIPVLALLYQLTKT